MSQVQHRVVGVLPSAAVLQGVIDRLEVAGFDRSQFGVLAKDAALAGSRKTADQIAADPSAPTEAQFEPESEGALTGALVGGLFYLGAAAAAGAVILTGGGLGLALAALVGAGGAGGLTGLLLAHGFESGHAEMINEQLARGGLVLWIQPRDAGQSAAAVAALQAAGADKIVS
jgi:hypothetical protein